MLFGHHQPKVVFVSWQGGNTTRGFGVDSSVRKCLSLAGDRFLVGPPPTQCFPLFPGRTGPGRLCERQRGGGTQKLCLEASSCCCSLFFSFGSGKQAFWTVAMFQCPFCPSHNVLVTGTMASIIFGPYFWSHSDGLWWWKYQGERWYFDEARASQAVGYICLEVNLVGGPGLGWHGDSWDWFGPIPPTWEEWWEWKAEGW